MIVSIFALLPGRKEKEYVRFSLWLLFFVAALLLWRTKPVVDGVWAVKLVGGCQVEIYSPHHQGVWTAAWACPGEDMTRLWPWPVQFPWFEQPLTPQPPRQRA